MKENDTKYYFDDKGVLNVSKRKLEDIAFWNTL